MREQLEAALRARWTRENLSVYGDYLQSQNDPRGELIALDLHAQTHGVTPDVDARRKEIIMALVGRDRIAALSRSSVELGFISMLEISGRSLDHGIEHVLASPLGKYVRAVRLHGEKTLLKKLVSLFVRHTHPWLARIEVVHSESFMTLATEPFISPRATKKLVAATPALRRFVIAQGARDRAVFPPFTHPTARIQVVDWHGRAELRQNKVRVHIGDKPPADIDLALTTRLLAATQLSADERLAWLDFMILVDGLVPSDGLDSAELPAITVGRALAAIDVTLPDGEQWVPVRDRLVAEPNATVRIARL